MEYKYTGHGRQWDQKSTRPGTFVYLAWVAHQQACTTTANELEKLPSYNILLGQSVFMDCLCGDLGFSYIVITDFMYGGKVPNYKWHLGNCMTKRVCMIITIHSCVMAIPSIKKLNIF